MSTALRKILVGLVLAACGGRSQLEGTDLRAGVDEGQPSPATAGENEGAAVNTTDGPPLGGGFESGTMNAGGSMSEPEPEPEPKPEPEPEPLSSRDYYVQPERGNDVGPGSEAEPFKTLEHAASLAINGDTIWIDGVLLWQTEPAFRDDIAIRIAHGVELRAVNPGFAQLLDQVNTFGMGGLLFEGDAKLSGLHFIGFKPALRADHGVLELDDVTFESPWYEGICDWGKQAQIMLSGSARMTMRISSRGAFIGYGKCLLRLDDDAWARVEGGHVSGAAWEYPPDAVAIFSAWGRSKLELEGLTLRENVLPIIGAWGSSHVSVSRMAVEGGARPGDYVSPLMHLSDEATLSIESSSLDGVDLQECVRTSWPQDHERLAGTLLMKDVTLSHCTVALSLRADTTVRLERVAVSDSGTGIIMRDGVAKGGLEVRDSRVTGNVGSGLELDPGMAQFSLLMRGTAVTRNGADGIRLGRAPGAGGVLELDLGTSSDQGANIVRDNGKSLENSVNLRIMDDVVQELWAVGNAWDAGVQGSDRAGAYYSNMVGANVYVADHQLAGTNYAFSGTATDTVTLTLWDQR